MFFVNREIMTIKATSACNPELGVSYPQLSIFRRRKTIFQKLLFVRQDVCFGYAVIIFEISDVFGYIPQSPLFELIPEIFSSGTVQNWSRLH